LAREAVEITGEGGLNSGTARSAGSKVHSGETKSINALKGLDAYESKLENSKPPLNVAPFFLNDIMLIWAGQYTLLGWLIVILNPAKLAPIRRWEQARPLVLIGQ
jgi:hypothetical protein